MSFPTKKPAQKNSKKTGLLEAIEQTCKDEQLALLSKR
jgi:hypothetical protein